MKTISDLFTHGQYMWLDREKKTGNGYIRIVFTGGRWVLLEFKKYCRRPVELLATRSEEVAVREFAKRTF